MSIEVWLPRAAKDELVGLLKSLGYDKEKTCSPGRRGPNKLLLV